MPGTYPGYHRPGTKPLLGYGLNPAHPLVPGCQLYQALNEGSGNLLNDLAARRAWTLTGGTWLATPGGIGIQTGTVAAQVDVSPRPISLASGMSWTYWWYGVMDTTNTGDNPGFWRSGTGGGGTFAIIQGGTTGRPWIRVAGTNVLLPGSGPSFPIGTLMQCAFVFRNGSAGEWWLNGSLAQSATTTATQDADSIAAFGWQGNFLAVGTIHGQWLAHGFWSRALSIAEINALQAEPFGLVQAPAVRRFYAPVVRASGVGLIGPSLISIGGLVA